MENIRSYEDMENYVRNQIENSWDFVDKDPWGFIIMRVGIQGKYEHHSSSYLWLAGDEAEERTSENIKSLAVDLWKQWKEYELDE